FNAIPLRVFRQEGIASLLIFLGKFFVLLLLLYLKLFLIGQQCGLDFLAAQSLGFFIASLTMLKALNELLHLKVRQVIAHALAHHQSHAVADFSGVVSSEGSCSVVEQPAIMPVMVMA